MKKTLIYCRQIQGVKNPIAVSYRNAEILAKDLGADLIMRPGDKISKDYDVIILTYANRYTDFETLKSVIKKDGQKRFGIKSEYEEVGYDRPYFRPFFTIANYVGGGDYFINTNLLISREPNRIIEKKYDCIYYSRYRADRMIYCKEYLQGDIYLSTHPKNHKHFYHAGCRPKLIKHIDWTEGKETLNQFRYSLYIEDKYTHNVFNNLANRWYEAGFCNVVVFFDINCKNTVEKSEIAAHFDPYYYVSNHAELMQKIQECNKNWYHHIDIQREWRKDELRLRAQMIEDLKKIIYA